MKKKESMKKRGKKSMRENMNMKQKCLMMMVIKWKKGKSNAWVCLLLFSSFPPPPSFPFFLCFLFPFPFPLTFPLPPPTARLLEVEDFLTELLLGKPTLMQLLREPDVIKELITFSLGMAHPHSDMEDQSEERLFRFVF